MPLSLDALPPEILFHILSYSSPFDSTLTPKHPLYTLAATCRQLCSVAEEYSRGLLNKHANIKPPRNPKTNAFVCRRKWIRWLAETCQLCKKASRRKAILDTSLTCCSKCDKTHFPKMTMTEAITRHGLSKLDLFTPNRLHPSIPPLTIGSYMCMGGETLMLSTPSVLARKSYIHARLGNIASDTTYLRRRVAAHDRIIQHMDVAFGIVRGKGRWIKAYKVFNEEGEAKMKGPRSLMSVEGREAYVQKGLEREWEAMGMQGRSEETAVEID